MKGPLARQRRTRRREGVAADCLEQGFSHQSLAAIAKYQRWVGEDIVNIVVIGMGYVAIPCAALLADVPGFRVTGVQRRAALRTSALVDGRGVLRADEYTAAGVTVRALGKG